MTVPRFVFVAFFSLLLVAQQQVNSIAQSAKEDQAVAAAQAWLALIDQGKYEESWKEAASFFKKSVTSADWSRMVRSARTPVGKCNSRTVKSKQYTTHAPGAPDGEYVVIQFNSSFDKKKTAVETVTPMMDNGKWRVSGYFIK